MRDMRTALRRRAVDCTPDLQGQGNSSVAWSGNDRSRPEWIFDIDTLTKSMNYKLVVAGNQTNGNTVKRIALDVGFKPSGEEEKKHAGDQENEDSEVQNTEEPRFEDNAVDKNIVYGCEDDPNMPNLKEIVYSKDVDGVGFEDPEFPDRVYKVEKALYVLNQAPRAWYETLSTYLLDNGFQRGTIDKTLFIKKKDNGIFISQDQYVDEILKKFGFLTVKTASTSMETSKPLMKDEKVKDVNVYLYRSMIGSLMYLTSSRPNIMFVVCACARFQVTPKVSHLHAVKRIFRYLKGQPKLGLWYPKDSPFDLEAYTDGDYAGASLDRKSTTGGCQFLRSRLISWQCKKQTVVANSTTEAEYVAASILECLTPEVLIKGRLIMLKCNGLPQKKDKGWLEWSAKAAKDEIEVKINRKSVMAGSTREPDSSYFCAGNPTARNLEDKGVSLTVNALAHD
ncbi:uncharacterized mitochondrial protein-like protein [Tanacetum coccineum]